MNESVKSDSEIKKVYEEKYPEEIDLKNISKVAWSKWICIAINNGLIENDIE